MGHSLKPGSVSFEPEKTGKGQIWLGRIVLATLAFIAQSIYLWFAVPHSLPVPATDANTSIRQLSAEQNAAISRETACSMDLFSPACYPEAPKPPIGKFAAFYVMGSDHENAGIAFVLNSLKLDVRVVKEIELPNDVRRRGFRLNSATAQQAQSVVDKREPIVVQGNYAIAVGELVSRDAMWTSLKAVNGNLSKYEMVYEPSIASGPPLYAVPQIVYVIGKSNTFNLPLQKGKSIHKVEYFDLAPSAAEQAQYFRSLRLWREQLASGMGLPASQFKDVNDAKDASHLAKEKNVVYSPKSSPTPESPVTALGDYDHKENQTLDSEGQAVNHTKDVPHEAFHPTHAIP